jgi:hypothetical protein
MRITDDNGYNAAGKRRKAYCVAHSEFGKCEWIPVSERLPPEETRVLAYDGTSVFESEYMHGRWEWLADVTHWLPMPNPPEVT